MSASEQPIVLRLACIIGDGDQSYVKELLWEMPFLPRIGETIIVDDFSSHRPMEVWDITFNAVDDELRLHVSFDGSERDDPKDRDEFAAKLLADGWSLNWKMNT